VHSPGSVLDGKYRLEQTIGEGGMGTVWRATHVGLERPVAVKLMEPADDDSEDQVKRFLREARVAASVRDPQVVDILDFGTTPEGLPFMVMEMLVGESLADRIDEGDPLTVGETCRIVSQCLKGLAAVHATGIVHRDLKPDNIFLSKSEDGLSPKLVDFGISRMLHHKPGVTFVTRTGMILGTPHYMSPEQARGSKGFDHRADLYSMGVILYEALTARLPFEAENIADLLTQIWTATPPPLHSRRADLEGALSEFVRKAIARDPDDRFQSAKEMREALDAVTPSVGHLPPPNRYFKTRSDSTFNVALADTTNIPVGAAADTTGSLADTTGRVTDTSPVAVGRDRTDTNIDALLKSSTTDRVPKSEGDAETGEVSIRDRTTTNVDGMVAPAPAARGRTDTAVDGFKALSAREPADTVPPAAVESEVGSEDTLVREAPEVTLIQEFTSSPDAVSEAADVSDGVSGRPRRARWVWLSVAALGVLIAVAYFATTDPTGARGAPSLPAAVVGAPTSGGAGGEGTTRAAASTRAVLPARGAAAGGPDSALVPEGVDLDEIPVEAVAPPASPAAASHPPEPARLVKRRDRTAPPPQRPARAEKLIDPWGP
jgi:serine/threonine protein kinase